MCYSAQIEADYRKYLRMFGASISLEEFYDLFWRRVGGSKVKIPKAMEAAFGDPVSDDEQGIKALIDEFTVQQSMTLEQELFKQRKRLADARRTLETKTTRAATESQRIAADKIALDQRDPRAQRRRGVRRHQSGGAGADDHQAVAVGGLRIAPPGRTHVVQALALVRVLNGGRMKVVARIHDNQPPRNPARRKPLLI